jgi:hypothetical protein
MPAMHRRLCRTSIRSRFLRSAGAAVARCAAVAALFCATASASAASLTVYDGALENGFADYYSWASTYSFASSTVVRGSETHAIAFKPSNWGGIRVLAANGNARYPIENYASLTFWINGGSGSGQKINLTLQLLDPAANPSQTASYGSLDVGSRISGGIAANTWKQVTIDFDALGLTYGSVNALVFQDGSGATQQQVYLTDIVFNTRTNAIATGAPVNVSVDTHHTGNLLNPMIFGVAYGDGTRNGQIGYSVRRWGGNSTTRYNWQVDVNNTANDYFFENIPNGRDRTQVPPLDGSADKFIGDALAGGSRPLMTIPTIGWTPRADSALNHPYTVGFSVAKYGAQQQTDPWDANAGNGYHTDGTAITGNDPTDSSTRVGPTFQQQWIAHMQSAFGAAGKGGVRYFTLDNEVMLWNSTHRDVHPNAPTEDEIWAAALSYGMAIKQQEPNARVTGPVTWGYCDLFWSAADDCGQSNADRNAHGGLPFVAWYLQQNCANGRPVDYLDLHYYPQGSNVALSDDDSPATAALRLRSLRELYDPNWASESWIGTLGNSAPDNLSTPKLLPRVHAWINQYCPNTKLAITEYNWGNDDTTTGAVAQAEALAIFAREGLDMATRWVAPAPNTVAENAFSIFLNYDGSGSRIGGYNVAASSSNVDQVGSYAFDIPGQRTMVLLTNKDVVFHDAALSFSTARSGSWRRYAFSGSSALAPVGGATAISGTSLTVSALPPMSVTLIVLQNPAIDYVPLSPARLLDTRTASATIDDVGAGTGALAPGETRVLQVGDRGGVPRSAVTAVALNVTAVTPQAGGYLTIWSGTGVTPLASNLNLNPGYTIPNLVISQVDAGGHVSIFNGSTTATNVIVDVQGYLPNGTSYVPLTPARLLDTRNDAPQSEKTVDGIDQGVGALPARGAFDLQIGGRASIPAMFGAAVLNVAAVAPVDMGYVTAWPYGTTQPLASNLNLNPPLTIPNLVVAGVGSKSGNGTVSLFNGSTAATHLIADAQGYFPTASSYTALVPRRVLDTRPGQTSCDGDAQYSGAGAIARGAHLDLAVAGRCGGAIPATGVGAVVLNVTAVQPASPGYLTVWPTGATQPLASSLNLNPGTTMPNLVIAKVGTLGQVSIYNGGGAPANVVVDVQGWFPSAP